MAEPEKPTLLLVEDSRALSGIIEKKLQSSYQVQCAYNGEDAIRLLKSGVNYTAAVIDLVLPKADGFEVMRVLRGLGQKIPMVVITARPRHAVEKDAMALGALELFIKPLDLAVLEKVLNDAVAQQRRLNAGDAMINPATGKKLPFRAATKCCYICGYEKVHVFLPIREGFSEDWSHGAYPVYKAKGGYDAWDFLKSHVMVCPYCFFASGDPEDFAPAPDAPYPYSEESKKILARSITVRKRLVPEAKDVDMRFDSPFRKKDRVMQSLLLANKCCNGLILAGKKGSYGQAGIYCALLGTLMHPDGENYYREAFTSFENQLKIKDNSRLIRIKNYYFCVVLNMLLSRTALGRPIMQEVENMYQDKRLEDLQEEEREWLMRITHAWKNGIDYTNPRDIT